jgi:predicted dehydrogenase
MESNSVEKILRAGLVGCGSLAQRGILPHVSLPDARETIQLTAVVDAVEERAQLTAARFQIPAYYTRIEEMLNADNVDVVLVATPIPFHFQNALAAVNAGKHVYVQKTMTATLDEANELLAARDRKRVKLAAAPGFALFPLVNEMRALIEKDVLGAVYLAYTYTIGFAHEQETIRGGQGVLAEIDPSWYYRVGGGPVPDVTVYALQLATTVLGPVARVTSLGNKRLPSREWRGNSIAIEVNDNNVVLLEFESGALGVAVGADCQGSATIPWGALSIMGRAGSLEVTEVDWASAYPLRFQINGGVWDERAAAFEETRLYTSALTDQPYLRDEHLRMEEPHVYADIMDLVDAIQQDRAPGAPGEQARHVVEIVEKARAAQATGQTQWVETRF